MKKISIIMAIIISFMNTVTIFADNNENVKTYKYENDIKMNGVVSSNDKFFNIQDNWNVKNAKINLVFTKSELIDVDYSTITVLVNDTPVESQRLSGKKEYKKNTEIEIPTDLLVDGYNKVSIKAYKTMSDKVCRDDSNTANWLVIHEESNISVNYNYKQNSNLISNYPDIYFNVDNGSNMNTTLLVPNDYTSGELSAGMILSSDFGSKSKYDNINFDFKLYKDFKNENNNVIFVGKESNTPSEILNLLSENEKSNLDKKCVIKQVESIFNKNKKMLLIISNNDELLKNGAKLLSSNSLISNLNKSSIIIDENTTVKDLEDEEDNNRIFLEELGYEKLFVKGPFSQEIIMDVNVPKEKLVTDSSKLRFNIRYANNLDFERSLATVYVNNIPIGSKKLSKDKSDNDTLEFEFPDEVVGKNYYQIKVVFNLELVDLECVTRDTDNPWAYISSEDSFIEFAYEDNNKLNFANYPYPFVENNALNDIKVVVPSKLTSKELTNTANIVSYLGREVDSNNGDLSVVQDNELTKEDKSSNLLVIGTPKNNSIIKDLNSSLNLKFKDDFSGYESDDKIQFVDNFASQVSSIQLIKSPYDNEKNAIVISATNSKYLDLATTYLTNLGLTKSLKGDTVVLGENSYIEDLSYNTQEKNEKEIVESKTISKNTIYFIVIAVFLLMTIIVSVTLLLRKYKM